jgi:hypothetical protein
LILIKLCEKGRVVVEVVIAPSDVVVVTEMNHIIEVQHMQKMNTQAPIRKLDKHTYLDLRTGEIKEFELSENRAENRNSLRQTFKRLRYLINANFRGGANELHVVLTYAENMTDTKRLYTDSEKFIKRLRYKYRDVSTIDYLSVVEPQGRGAWHCHVLLRFNDLETIFIPNEEMARLWGQGFTKVKSVKAVDNIGAYLSAYLTDIEVREDIQGPNIKEVDGKRFIKGGRLWLYPPGMNLYRKSKGIKFPERKKMTYEEAKKIVGSAKPTFEKVYEVECGDFQNRVTFQQYNLKRTQ